MLYGYNVVSILRPKRKYQKNRMCNDCQGEPKDFDVPLDKFIKNCCTGNNSKEDVLVFRDYLMTITDKKVSLCLVYKCICIANENNYVSLIVPLIIIMRNIREEGVPGHLHSILYWSCIYGHKEITKIAIIEGADVSYAMAVLTGQNESKAIAILKELMYAKKPRELTHREVILAKLADADKKGYKLSEAESFRLLLELQET